RRRVDASGPAPAGPLALSDRIALPAPHAHAGGQRSGRNTQKPRMSPRSSSVNIPRSPLQRRRVMNALKVHVVHHRAYMLGCLGGALLSIIGGVTHVPIL